MKVFKFLLVTIGLSVSFMTVSLADECDYDSYKQMAELVNVNSEFNYSSLDIGIFDENLVTVSGLSQELYAVTSDRSIGFYYDGSNGGSSVKVVRYGPKSIKIYSSKCPNKVLKTIPLKLQKYNAYSDYDECNGIGEKLDVCSQFYEKDLTYDQFVKAINEFKTKKDTDSLEDDFGNIILNFLKNNIWMVIILTVIVIGAICFYVVRRIKRNKLD